MSHSDDPNATQPETFVFNVYFKVVNPFDKNDILTERMAVVVMSSDDDERKATRQGMRAGEQFNTGYRCIHLETKKVSFQKGK